MCLYQHVHCRLGYHTTKPSFPLLAIPLCESAREHLIINAIPLSILESMAVLYKILHVQARFSCTYTCVVTAETFNCACMCAQESVSILLPRHWETMTTPMQMHTCTLCMHLPVKIKIYYVQLPYFPASLHSLIFARGIV